VPDQAYHRGRPKGTWVPTAAIVVEIVSPDDETYEKFAFYSDHQVDEIIVADPTAQLLTMWRTTFGGRYEEAQVSALLEVTASHLTAAILWPNESD
jgi:Uma2 family endonuclease